MTTTVLLLVATFNLSVGIAQQQGRQPIYDSVQRLKWHRQHLQMRHSTPHAEFKWRHIGPQLMGGRVTAIAKLPGREFEFYVGAASGGVWKTSNEGTTWEPIFDDAPSGSVGAIAIAPSNPATVWVGLGEANILRSSMAGTGIYRSDDHGKTWSHCGLAETHHIARIVVHPRQPDIVFVAASGKEFSENNERGVFRTDDGGKSWNKVLYFDSMTGAIDLVLDPEKPEVVYASMWRRIRRPWSDPLPDSSNGVFKSTDGGDTWLPLTNGLPQGDHVGRIGLSISHSDPDVLYAIVDNQEVVSAANADQIDAYGRQKKFEIRGAEVYRSDDAGCSWRKTHQDSPELKELFATYGWVFGQIRVDPNDPDTVYALGVSLLKSIDGGQSFELIKAPDLHADHHDLWIAPGNSNYLISGNDGGINISYDGGESWRDIDNLPIVQFYNVAADNNVPFRVYGSIQDNGSWCGPSNHKPGRNEMKHWRRVPGGEASYMAIDPLDGDLLYSESFYGSLLRSNLRTGESTSIKPTIADEEVNLRGQWLAPFKLSAHNSQIIYHGFQFVFRSLDRGETWQRISPDLTRDDPKRRGNVPFGTITTISESPLQFGLIYVGTDDGRIHRTNNSGVAWQELTGNWPRDKWVARIVASRFDANVVYLALNGRRQDDFQIYLFRSKDGGESWSDIGYGIPGGPVNVICEDPSQARNLYVGTDSGIFASTDAGQSWSVLGSGLPITFVHDIAIQEREKAMVIATHGRGMYTLDIADLSRQPVDQN